MRRPSFLTPRFPLFCSSALLQLVCETFRLILQDIDKQVRGQAEHGCNDNAKRVAIQIVDSSKPSCWFEVCKAGDLRTVRESIVVSKTPPTAARPASTGVTTIRARVRS